MSKVTLVTGVTGNVGQAVAFELLRRKQEVRGAVLADELPKAREIFGADIELAVFDFNVRETWSKAFQGVQRMFLMRPPAIADVANNINPSVDEAMKMGVDHFVFLSLLGVAKNPIVPHHKIEKHILRRKANYTFLRPSFFMQNLIGFFKEFIVKENILFCPAGHGKTSFIDTRDIAAIGALALSGDQHINRAYDLTGGEALSYFEVADLMSAELGRKITFANPGVLAFRRKLTAMKMDPTYINVLTGIFLTAKFGVAKVVTPDTNLLLGRAPITVKQFVADHREHWV